MIWIKVSFRPKADVREFKLSDYIERKIIIGLIKRD
jgi:hypothetical protein